MEPNFAFTRRGLLKLAGASAAVGALAACAGPGGGGGGGATTSAPGGSASGGASAMGLDPSKANGAISFAHWRGEDKAAFDEIIAQFIEKYPDVTEVRQDITPSNDYQSNALQQVRQGTVGDIFAAFRGAQFAAMKDAGLYVDLGPTGLADKYESGLIAEGVDGSSVWGLPYQLVFNMPITNEAIFEQVGISELPADWESYLAMCEQIKGAGLVPLAWPGGEMGNAGQLFNCMLMNEAPSDDMCTKIESGEYKVTDDWYLSMLRKYQELTPYFQDNSTGTAVEPAQQMFASGQAAMLATGSFHMAAVRGLGADFPMGLLAPITAASPADAKYEGIHNATFALGVSSVSENQDTAYALLEMLSDPEVAGAYGSATAQYVTVKGVSYDNEDLNHTSDWASRNTLLAPRFQFLNLDIRNAAEAACIAVVGGTSPEQAAEEAQQIIDQQINA